MLRMTPMVVGMQMWTLMVIIGLQAMIVPPAALPTLQAVKKGGAQR